MIDIVGFLNSIVDLIDHLFRVAISIFGKDLFVALFTGFVVSGGSTQFIKFIPILINSKLRVMWTILWGMFSAFVPVFVLYPTPDLSRRFLYALAAAASAPWLYRLTIKIIGKLSPAMRANLSGNPEYSFRSDLDVKSFKK